MASILKVDEIKERSQGNGLDIVNLNRLSLKPSAAPSNPVQGDMYLDSSDNKLKIYNSTDWITIINATPSFSVEYLVIGGGGSGGGQHGGGGGAGGYITSKSGEYSGGNTIALDPVLVNLNESYSVIVGAGGASVNGGTSPNYGNSGFSSQFVVTATGGGRGNGWSVESPGTITVGGSGGSGGGSSLNGTGGNGTSGQGNNGGSSTGSSTFPNGGGGGGGAGNIGENSTNLSRAGNGGNGLSNSITGTSVTRAGGGAGGSHSPYSIGTGGSGGGGDGGLGNNANPSGRGGDGTVNTGSGGGGSGSNSSDSGAGGKGIVIISYPNTNPDLASIDVSHTCRGATTVSGTTTPPAPSTARTGYKTYEFLDGDGNISW